MSAGELEATGGNVSGCSLAEAVFFLVAKKSEKILLSRGSGGRQGSYTAP